MKSDKKELDLNLIGREPGLVDPGNLLSAEQQAHLNQKINSLSFPCYVVIKPEKDRHTMQEAASLLEKHWQMKSGKVVFMIDMADHQLYFSIAPKLEAQGVTRSYVDNVLQDKFYPYASKGDFSRAIEESLDAMQQKVNLFNKMPRSQRQKVYSQQADSGRPKSYDGSHHGSLSSIAGVFFIAILILIVVAMKFKGKPQNEIDLRQFKAEYVAKMEKLKALYETNKKLYFAKIVGMVCLGYVYLGLVLVVLLMVLAFTCVLLLKFPFLKLGLPLLLLTGVILKALWVNFPPVGGIELKRNDYPRLHQTVEEIRARIAAPKVHAIYLVPELNAAVAQRPRLGLFGWQKNYLLIGTELLLSFSADEIRSVLAHEMGHLAGNHGARSAWIYRVQSVWSQIANSLEHDESFLHVLFVRFCNWYVPELENYTFLYRREQEYNADLSSTDLVGKDRAAQALIGVDIKASYLRTYWEEINERFSKPEPPMGVYRGITAAINKNLKPHQAQRWLQEELNRETNYEDSHPSLKDRIAAILNMTPAQAEEYAHANLDNVLAIEEAGFYELLGKNADELLRNIEEDWRESVKEYWIERNDLYNKTKESLEELLAKDTESLSNEDFATIAYNSFLVDGYEKSKSRFEEALEHNPEDPELIQFFGERMLEENDPRSIELLESAMKLDRTRQYDCSWMIYGYLMSRNEKDKASRYEEIAIDWMEEKYKRDLERYEITNKDVFMEHDLNEEQLKYLISQIEAIPFLDKVYLVRKQVEAFKEVSLYVLLFKTNREESMYPFYTGEIKYPGDFRPVDWESAPRSLIKAVETIENSRLR